MWLSVVTVAVMLVASDGPPAEGSGRIVERLLHLRDSLKTLETSVTYVAKSHAVDPKYSDSSLLGTMKMKKRDGRILSEYEEQRTVGKEEVPLLKAKYLNTPEWSKKFTDDGVQKPVGNITADPNIVYGLRGYSPLEPLCEWAETYSEWLKDPPVETIELPEGRTLFRFQPADVPIQLELEVDPKCGNLPTRTSKIGLTDGSVFEYVVEEYQETDAGISIPKVYRKILKGPQFEEEIRVIVDSFQANPQFEDNAELDFSFPPGTVVYDEISGLKYTMGEAAQQSALSAIAFALENQANLSPLERLKSLPIPQTYVQQANATAKAVMDEGPRTSRNAYSNRLFIVFVLSILLALACFVFLFVRLRRRKGAGSVERVGKIGG